MPVILRPEDEAAWLDASLTEYDDLAPLLQSYPAELMAAYNVSTAVGNVRVDSLSLVDPTGPAMEGGVCKGFHERE